MGGRLFRVGEILGLISALPPLGIRTEVGTGDLVFVSDDELITHMCGEVHPMEYGMVLTTARDELLRQLPWLAGLDFPCSPDRLDWPRLWAWIDTVERRYGGAHRVHPLRRAWRSGIDVTEFRGYDELDRPVGFHDLPVEIRSLLLRLGYRNG